MCPADLWSEDADSLREALHVCILPSLIIGGRCGGRRHQVGGVRQRVLLGEGLPAAIVALVGDVTLAQFGLQLSQVQPCLIVLSSEGMKLQPQELQIMVNGLLLHLEGIIRYSASLHMPGRT